MARAGDVLDNPIQGDTVTILKAAAETDGEYLQAEIALQPHAAGPPLHIHPRLEDRFKGVDGTVGVQIGAETRTLRPGDEAVAPPGTAHRFWNPTGDPARLLAEVRPFSDGFTTFLETLYGLTRDGKTNDKGLPSPLQAAVLFHAYRDDVALATPPLLVQRALFGVLAPLGRLLGYRASYPEYSGLRKAREPTIAT